MYIRDKFLFLFVQIVGNFCSYVRYKLSASVAQKNVEETGNRHIVEFEVFKKDGSTIGYLIRSKSWV